MSRLNPTAMATLGLALVANPSCIRGFRIRILVVRLVAHFIQQISSLACRGRRSTAGHSITSRLTNEVLFTAVKAVAMIGALASAAACTNGSTLRWTEDVKLPDGRVITLERYTEFKGGSSQFGEPSTESLQRFEFKHPTTGEVVRWESSKERVLLKTVALWLENNTPMLLTEPAYVGELRRLKCPNPPYLVFEHVNGQWRDRPLGQIGVDQLRSNITTHALEKRKHIESSKHRLDAQETSDSYAFYKGTRRVPYILKLKGMPTQTFDEKNCNDPTRTFDDLLQIDGK